MALKINQFTYHMNEEIATNIETELFYSILKHLIKSGWKTAIEYDAFDKGIDFDFYELKFNDTSIWLAWCNWFEGEIKAPKLILDEVEKTFDTKFEFGIPAHLNENIPAKYKSLLKVK